MSLENLEKILKKGVDNGGRIWYIKRAVAEGRTWEQGFGKSFEKSEKRG